MVHEEGTKRGRSRPRPLLAVPNITAHPSTASVPITVSLYNGPLLCDFDVSIKELMNKKNRNIVSILRAVSSMNIYRLLFKSYQSPCSYVQHCGNAWTSMKGRVIFWIKFNPEQQSGTVYFKLFGQRCQKCMPETFEHSMWYPEEVVKVR